RPVRRARHTSQWDRPASGHRTRPFRAQLFGGKSASRAGFAHNCLEENPPHAPVSRTTVWRNSGGWVFSARVGDVGDTRASRATSRAVAPVGSNDRIAR